MKSLPDPYDAVKLVRQLAEGISAFKVAEAREALFLSVLLEGAEAYDWNPDDPAALRRIADLVKLIMELPEYQLA